MGKYLLNCINITKNKKLLKLFSNDRYLNLKDKVAVITGGSRGIGKSIAILLSKKGVKVIICARNINDLKNVSEVIKRNGGICNYIAVDISDEKQIDVLVSKVLTYYNRVDLLINNAGIGIYKPLIDSTLDDWNKIINTNLRGPFLCSKAFAPIIMKQKKGYIINIASGAGKVGLKNLSIYCASKFGLIGFTEAMRKELKEFGIEVFSYCPGYVKTSFFNNFPSNFHLPSKAKDPDDIAEEVMEIVIHKKKVKRYFRKIYYKLLNY